MRNHTRCLLTLSALAAFGTAAAPSYALDGWGVEVPLDVEVFDTPGGEGKKRSQDLNGGSWVILYEERDDHWCHVGSHTDPVPGAQGWIWCGVGNDGQSYALRRLSAEEINAPKPGK